MMKKMKPWQEKIKSSCNPKVICMLSGGKDSIAALIILKQSGVNVTAIHFIHKWSSDIPTNEAKRICDYYNIPLIIYDYTMEFCNAVDMYTGGRPCLICKKEMYKILLKYVASGDYGWIGIGDNANDRTTISRIKQYLNTNDEQSLFYNRYFGSEMGIKLPDNVMVLRPLIQMQANDVEDFLRKEHIQVQRINSTGDKYFEYHREGCPVQFADIGVELNPVLYSKLKEYNDCITEFARMKGILASIHMPSTFIITIPKGYENEAAEYLTCHGLTVDSMVNSSYDQSWETIIGTVYDLDNRILDTRAYEKIFIRFLERLELFGKNYLIENIRNIIHAHYFDTFTRVIIIFNFDLKIVDIKYTCLTDKKSIKDVTFIDNLIIELFRTRKFRTKYFSEHK